MSSMAESFFTEVIARKKKQRTQLKMWTRALPSQDLY
jgi:hypothetical protein